ncbi:hypothetical protein D3C81_1179490 [compost metagenome]
MAFIPLPGQSLRADIGHSITAYRLQQLESIKTNPLLKGWIAVNFHIGMSPELPQESGLFLKKGLKASLLRHTKDLFRPLKKFSFRIVLGGMVRDVFR